MSNENNDNTHIEENKLLQELNKPLLNMNIHICDIGLLKELINDFLFEHNLDPKNVLEILRQILFKILLIIQV
ncbi:hypothetical protein C1645_832908 [Glomus cerebriforme]|uniref:Uncharacterized protein n=1 Tax=Glomus cerebriforme TaxID=658196 RepID=A0A397SIM2_9GLOM|nr:hypothetical protein C1645_832908 [Glomus cerebriforme]